jgi:hypothetical protein
MFRRNQMEIIIAVLAIGVVLWWFFVREDKKPIVEDAPSVPYKSVPYKVPEPPATTPIPLVVKEPVVAVKAPAKPKAPARTTKPKVVAKAPAKAPAKPRATKTKPQA